MFIVEAYFRQRLIQAAQLQFKQRFGCREFPVHSMICRWVNKFKTHGTVYNFNRKDTNRQSPLDDRNHQGHHTTKLCYAQFKQVCASAKSGAGNQPGAGAENFDRISPHVSLQDTD